MRLATAAVGTVAAAAVVGLTVVPGTHRAGAAPAPAVAPRAATVAPGSVWGWGSNQSFQADPAGPDRFVNAPRAVRGLAPASVVQVAAGGFSGYALLTDGTVRSWGANDLGQLGNGTLTASTGTPANVLAQPTGLTGITQIAAGEQNAFAIGAGGVVFGWGDNESGGLGDGTTTERLTPVRIDGLSGITQVAANRFVTYAVAADGTVWSWGEGGQGLLGDGSPFQRLRPAKIPGLTGVVQIATSDKFALALLSDGTVRAWGDNSLDALGTGGQLGITPDPQTVPNLTGIVHVAAGGDHGMAVDRTGRVWVWGTAPALDADGSGNFRTRARPVLLPGLTGVVQVAANDGQSIALTAGGAVFAWGDNGPSGSGGTLGVGSTATTVPVPQVVAGRERVTQLVTGGDGASIYAVTAGTGEVWGYAWADQPSAPLNTSYDPSTHYAADSAGTRVHVTRTAVGTYTVNFPGLGVSGQGGSETAQLSPFGNTLNHCTLNGIGGRLNIVVLCSNPAGAPADTSFVVQYFRGGVSTHDQGYLYANQPTATSYTAGMSFNSRGGVNTVSRRGPGNYLAHLPGFTDATGGNVAVTAFGTNANYCKINSWVGGEINVLCFTPTGVPVDEAFMLRYTDQSVANDRHAGAYVWQNVLRDNSHGPYPADPGSSYNSTGGQNTINQTNVGTYQVFIPGLAAVDATNAIVTADNPGNTFCTVNGWNATGTGTAINVLCHNATGGLANTLFTLSYLTNF